MLYNPSCEKILLIPNPSSLVQRKDIFSHPITCYLGEDTDPNPNTTSFQLVVEGNTVFPELSFLQIKHNLGHLALLNSMQLTLAH